MYSLGLKHEEEENEKQRHEEYQYLDIIRECIEKGNERIDRTLVGTNAVFGRTMRFNLRDDIFPLITTRKIFWRGAAEELLWIISGKTSSKILSEKGIKHWDANGSRDFLDGRGLFHYKEGDLGPVYGFQWR
jgi:thymidylate synthase